MSALGSELAAEEGEEVSYAEPEGIMRSEALKTPALWGVCFIAFALSASCQGSFRRRRPILQISATVRERLQYLSA